MLLALAAVLTLPAVAPADDWWLVSYGGEKPGRLVVFMDRGSIEHMADGTVRMRELDYQEGLAGGIATYSRARIEHDCAAHSFRALSDTHFSVDGAALTNTAAANPRPVTKAPDGTMGAKELAFACGKATGAARIVGSTSLVKIGEAVLAALDRPTGEFSEAR